ncbi:LysR substrate-binding domain-containing protein [Cupriavidus sp. 2MCAB6]|uniref:LysR substrate-binding domain-containing protein n=1 Tax=Cupriavidus sp. 2MCAB6 TaxID=3232981 RepID=UPI003F93D22E
MWQIDPTSLRLFIAVCEEGTIARASEREFIAPSAVSKRISDIEDGFRTPLLVRSQRGVTPTPAGEALLRHARQIMRGIERLQAELGEYADGMRGHVRMLANVSSMVEFLPEELTSFLQQNPGIQVDLEERVSPDVVRGVAEGNADLGICRGYVATGDLEALPYRADHLAVVVNAGHALAASRTLCFEDTLDYDQLGLSSTASLHTLMSRIAAEKGRSLRIRTHVSTIDGAYRLIQSGLGLGILPLEAVGRYAEMYGLRAIPLSDAWATGQFVICMRSADSLSLAARKLLDHLLARVPAPVSSATPLP